MMFFKTLNWLQWVVYLWDPTFRRESTWLALCNILYSTKCTTKMKSLKRPQEEEMEMILYRDLGAECNDGITPWLKTR